MASVSSHDPPGAPTVLAEHVCRERNAGDEITHLSMYRIEETVTLETVDSPADRD